MKDMTIAEFVSAAERIGERESGVESLQAIALAISEALEVLERCREDQASGHKASQRTNKELTAAIAALAKQQTAPLALPAPEVRVEPQIVVQPSTVKLPDWPKQQEPWKSMEFEVVYGVGGVITKIIATRI